MDWSQQIQANAWTGEAARGAFAKEETVRFARTASMPVRKDYFVPPTRGDERDWRDPRNGWGLVLPHRADLSPAQLATAADAPEPIQELVRQRNANVFRVPHDPKLALTFLRNWKTGQDLAI